jgi:hypothetical protein
MENVLPQVLLFGGAIAIITLAVRAYVISQRARPIESLRKGSPDPAFMGELLTYNFLPDTHFGLSKANLDDLVAPLPESIRDAARYWIVLYLSWVYGMKLRSKYGDAFFKTALQSACARFAVLNETAKFGGELKFWFEQLDYAAAKSTQTPIPPAVGADDGEQMPIEYFAALTLLALSPDSPFYRQSEFIGSGIELEFAIVLEKAKNSALPFIETTGEIGGSLNKEPRR